jgi:hypothetical protein
MALPLHDVRSTGGQDRESTARDARDAHPHYLLQTKEPFTLKLLSKAIGTAMYLVEAANGTRSMLADQ